MIEEIQGLPRNVVGFSASGEVTGDDYETVLIPALASAHEAHGKVRMLFLIGPDFEGFKAAAMWDDAKVGIKHFTHFEKIAIVTDNDLILKSIKTFGFMMPGELELFGNDQMEDAKTWILA